MLANAEVLSVTSEGMLYMGTVTTHSLERQGWEGVGDGKEAEKGEVC